MNLFTGERFLPHLTGNIYLEHYHRYYSLNSIVKDKIVLDIACGEGYGTNLLSKKAKKIYGIDISEHTISNAVHKYKSENLEFILGSTSKIPLPDNSIEVVVSFETIEHHDEHEEMISEIKRVLKEDGILVISSPDKSNYNKSLQKPNEFHVKELEYKEFNKLISRYFKYKKFFFQKLCYGSLITAKEDSKFSYITTKDEGFYNDFLPIYDIAIASNEIFDFSITSFLNGDEENYKYIEKLKGQIDNIYKSPTWRIGRLLLAPFAIFKKK